MIELKPCPFCGGEARVEHDDDGSAYLEVDHRPDCFLTYKDTLRWFYPAKGDMSAEEHAASEWNRRAERTCRVESSHEVEGDGCYSYFEYELTCGHEIAWGYQLPPSYCPECGRRVLYDSDDYI